MKKNILVLFNFQKMRNPGTCQWQEIFSLLFLRPTTVTTILTIYECVTGEQKKKQIVLTRVIMYQKLKKITARPRSSNNIFNNIYL